MARTSKLNVWARMRCVAPFVRFFLVCGTHANDLRATYVCAWSRIACVMQTRTHIRLMFDCSSGSIVVRLFDCSSGLMARTHQTEQQNGSPVPKPRRAENLRPYQRPARREPAAELAAEPAAAPAAELAAEPAAAPAPRPRAAANSPREQAARAQVAINVRQQVAAANLDKREAHQRAKANAKATRTF